MENDINQRISRRRGNTNASHSVRKINSGKNVELHVRDNGSFYGIGKDIDKAGLGGQVVDGSDFLGGGGRELLLDGLVAGSSPGIGDVLLLVTSLVLLVHRIKGATKISGKLRVFVRVCEF